MTVALLPAFGNVVERSGTGGLTGHDTPCLPPGWGA
jgi:hypothetical protein